MNKREITLRQYSQLEKANLKLQGEIEAVVRQLKAAKNRAARLRTQYRLQQAERFKEERVLLTEIENGHDAAVASLRDEIALLIQEHDEKIAAIREENIKTKLERDRLKETLNPSPTVRSSWDDLSSRLPSQGAHPAYGFSKSKRSGVIG